MPESRVRHFRVPHRDMVYLKFIVEAHEGLATLSTVDKLEGIVRLSFDPSVEPTVQGLVDALRREIPLTDATFDGGPGDPDGSGLR